MPAALTATATVYPRVGGGNAPVSCQAISWRGLSPRGRGKRLGRLRIVAIGGSIPAWAGETPAPFPACALSGLRLCGGLSPRGRGKRPLR